MRVSFGWRMLAGFIGRDVTVRCDGYGVFVVVAVAVSIRAGSG